MNTKTKQRTNCACAKNKMRKMHHSIGIKTIGFRITRKKKEKNIKRDPKIILQLVILENKKVQTTKFLADVYQIRRTALQFFLERSIKASKNIYVNYVFNMQ